MTIHPSAKALAWCAAFLLLGAATLQAQGSPSSAGQAGDFSPPKAVTQPVEEEDPKATAGTTPAPVPAEPSAVSESGSPITIESPNNAAAADTSNLTPEERFEQLISLDLRNIDVIEALKYLATKAGLNIVSTKNVSGRVTMTLERVRLKDVFDIMLRSNGLAFVRQGDIFNVMTEAEYKALYGKNFSDLRQVRVLRLKYAIPEQAYSLVDALKSDIGRVVVDQEAGNVLILDTPEKIRVIEGALEEFEKANTIRVIALRYARAKEVEEILKTRLDAKKVGFVKADERNNQVIVQTLANRMDEIVDLVKSLDKPTKEVLIDTKVVKISLSKQLDAGVEWEGIFGFATKFGKSYVGSTPFADITAGNATAAFTPRTTVLANNGGNVNQYPFSGTTASLSSSTKKVIGEELHYGIINGDNDFDVLGKYLNTIGDSKVLSNPKLVVVNNQEAKIHVGERQAYVTTTTTTGQTTSTISEEVTFVDVGIQLAVTPTINDDGYITMKVKPEVSSVTSILTTPTNNKIPIIDTSLTETTVMMKDGTTLLIGGLRKEEKSANSQETPFLGKIPLIGNLFKMGDSKTVRTELLVMITPHIIKGDELAMGKDGAYGEAAGKDYQQYNNGLVAQQAPQKKSPAMSPKSYKTYNGNPE